MYWDYSQFNSMVKSVEECGDKLNALAEVVGQTLVGVPDGRAKEMLVRLVKLAKHIDWEAVKMMAEYDGFAKKLKREGIRRDPRRAPPASIFRTDGAHYSPHLPIILPIPRVAVRKAEKAKSRSVVKPKS